MTYSDDLDCKIFVDTDVPARELAMAVAQLLSGTAAGPLTWTVSTADCAIDVLPNDDFDEERREAFPDGFLFFRYALEKGQDQAKKLDYVPLPTSLVQQIESYISANIK